MWYYFLSTQRKNPHKKVGVYLKYLYQFGIILIFSFAGELLHNLLPLPVPTSIYGLVLLLAALQFKIIKLEQIKETGLFLVNIMPFLFVSAGVGLMNSFDLLKPIVVPVSIITIVTTVFVMVVTGKTAELVIRKCTKKETKQRKDV